MKLITAMILRNEADRYLPEVLDNAWGYSDKIVVLDDKSDDNTVEFCEERGCNVYQHDNEEPLFWTAEHVLREYLWKHILPREAQTGDWIMAVDGDEIIAPQFIQSKDKIIAQENVNTYTFQFWEAWGSKDKIRIDSAWNPLAKHIPMLVRFIPSVNYRFNKVGLHCGRVPMNSPQPIAPTGCSVLHLGWANPDEHEEKYDKYVSRDKNPHPQMMDHYNSILGEPTLIDWFL